MAKIGNFYFRGNFQFEVFEPNFENAESFLKSSSGNFIWIYEDEEKVLFGTDTIRSYPLWYYYDGKEFCLSDDINFLKDKYQPKFDKEQGYFFEHVGYTCGETTLLESIYCPFALSIFEFNKKNSYIYSKHFVLQEIDSNFEEFEKPFNEASSQLFENLIEKLESKTAVIPLSAGWDSRFILAGLVKKGFSNIICFTYGKTNSYEIEIARATCEKLNIHWHFVEYNDAVFENYKTAFAWEYEQFASQYTSIAYEQDFFAVWKLKAG
jgi:asparagine synthase (glutamine-hydrolysing)